MVGALVKSTSHAGRLQESDPFFGGGIRRALWRVNAGGGARPGEPSAVADGFPPGQRAPGAGRERGVDFTLR